MDNFSENRYTLGKVRIANLTLGNFTNVNLALGEPKQIVYPGWIY